MRKRTRVLLVQAGLLALLFVLIYAVASGVFDASAGPLYSVAQIRTGLATHPAAWANRTVWVRAIATDFSTTDVMLIDHFPTRRAGGTAVLFASFKSGNARMIILSFGSYFARYIPGLPWLYRQPSKYRLHIPKDVCCAPITVMARRQ